MLISELIQSGNKRVDHRKALQFEKKGIISVDDLLAFKPRKYYDFTALSDLTNVQNSDMIVVLGRVLSVNKKESANGKSYISIKAAAYPSRQSITITIFNQSYLKDKFHIGNYVVMAGKASLFAGRPQLTNPMIIDPIDSATFDPARDRIPLPGIFPTYSKVQGISDAYLRQTLSKALQDPSLIHVDVLPDPIRQFFKLTDRFTAYRLLHAPHSIDDVLQAKKRLVFDDLLYYDTLLAKQANRFNSHAPFTFDKLDRVKAYIKKLPYQLTPDQQKAIETIIQYGQRGELAKMLVIGDVGYGKTEVAKAASLAVIDAGKQVAIMAPTQILATQHYNDFKKSFEGLDVNIALLHSGLKKKEQNEIIQQIQDGSIDVLIGTQSIISDDVLYKDLGMMIIDEEHRFGVEIRSKLADRYPTIYQISMSATPIPRTLAMSLYGANTVILPIQTAPANRKPVKTDWMTRGKEIADIQTTLDQGHQVYVVCPAIDPDDDAKMISVEEIAKIYIQKLGLQEIKAEKTKAGKSINKSGDAAASIGDASTSGLNKDHAITKASSSFDMIGNSDRDIDGNDVAAYTEKSDKDDVDSDSTGDVNAYVMKVSEDRAYTKASNKDDDCSNGDLDAISIVDDGNQCGNTISHEGSAFTNQNRADHTTKTIAVLNGKMKSNEQLQILQQFQYGTIDVLVATTMIEVGVNVPNATLMVIQDAQRFGLAQLHQLRGRVGRSNTIETPAKCDLVSDTGMTQRPSRLDILLESNDGFSIANADLKERGSGNWAGNEQSGANYYVDLILRYPKMNSAIAKLAKKIVKEDPDLADTIIFYEGC